MYTVYTITNKLNGKQYVGYSKNHLARWSQHKKMKPTNGKTSLIQKAIKKYGVENFSFDIIFESNDKEFTKEIQEPFFIQQLNTLVPNGYNIAKGGSGGATRTGMQWDANTKQKISISVSKAMTTERRNNLAQKARGRKASETTKKKMSASHRDLCWVSNLTTLESRFVHNNEAKQLLSTGWISGRKFNNPFINSKTNFRNSRKTIIS